MAKPARDVIEYVRALKLWRYRSAGGGVRPMSDLEVRLWHQLQRARRQIAKLREALPIAWLR